MKKVFKTMAFTLLGLVLSVNVMAAGEKTYTHAFSTKPTESADNTLSSVVWTFGSGTNLGSYNSGNYAGVQLGTKSATGKITMTTKNNWGEENNDYKGYTKIKEIHVWLNNGSGSISASVKVGGVAATASGTVSKNSSAKSYKDASKITYTPASNSNTGKIEIAFSTSSNAGYFCAVEVVCEQAATPTEKYTVTLKDDNTTLTEASAGAGVALPSRETTCTDYTFAGWSETNCATETTTAPTIIEAGEYKPTKNIELYPVFKKEEKGTSKNASVTIADYATAHSWQGSGAVAYTSITVDDNITVTTTGTGNNGKYYTDWRLYQNGNGNAIVTAKAGKISSVTFTFSVSNSGQLKYNSSVVTSGTAVTGINSQSATFVVGASSGTSGQVKITKIDVTYNSASTIYYVAAPTCSSAILTGIEVTGTPDEFWKGDSFNHNGITVTANYDDATSEDVTSKAEFSTPDMTTAGEKTITVSYKGKTDTYKINVQTIANTQATAYTVAQAKAIIDANPAELTTTNVYVKGTVSSIVTAFSESFGNISFNVSADGETTSDQFQFYRNFKGADKAKWTSADEAPQVGDEVIGYGTLAKHSSTYEFAEGNYIVSLNRPKKLTSITVSGTPDYFDTQSSFNHNGMTVTAHYNTGASDDADVTASAVFTAPDMTTEGEKTVKVSYTENEITQETSYKIQVAQYCANVVTITKGDEENGTFSLSQTGNICADGGLTIDVTDIVPAEHYHFKEITTTNGTVNDKTVTGITDDAIITVVFEEDTKYELKWMVSGEQMGETQSLYEGDDVTAPTGTVTVPEACANEGKVFVGWTADTDVDPETAPTFFAPHKMGTAPETFYAVFATKGAEGAATTEELTKSEIQSITNPKLVYTTEKTYSGSTLSYSIYGNTDNASRPWIQLKKDQGAYIKVTAPEDIKQVELTITSATNSSGGVTDITKHTAYSGSVGLVTTDCTFSTDSKNVGITSTITNNKATITTTASTKEVMIKVTTGARIWGIKTTYGAGATYSDYVTSCVIPTYSVTIQSNNTTMGTVTVDPEITAGTTYEAGTPFYVEATAEEGYRFINWTISDNNEGASLTYAVTETENIFTTGAADVTLTANFEAIPADPITVTLEVGEYGTLYCDDCVNNTITEVTAGDGVLVPDVIANEGWAFLGWSTSSTATEPEYEVADTFYPSDDNKTLYAVYAQLYKVTLKYTDEVKWQTTAGGAITLPSRDCKNETYKGHFAGWSITEFAEETTNPTETPTIYPVGDFVPTADITLYPVFSVSTMGGTKWVKTTGDKVTEGVYAIITADGHAFSGTISSGHGQVTTNAFAFTNDVATSAPSGTCEITMQAVTGGFKMYNADKGYLYATVASSGKLAWDTQGTTATYWSWASDNWMYAGVTNARIRDYSNSSIRTYGNNSGDGPVHFAKKESVAEAKYWSKPANDVTNPVLDTPAGDYLSPLTVKITAESYDDDLIYYYTTDGTTPAADAELTPLGTSEIYDHTTGIVLEPAKTYNLQVIGYDDDGYTSQIAKAEYVLYPVFNSISAMYAGFQNGKPVGLTLTDAYIHKVYNPGSGTTTQLFVQEKDNTLGVVLSGNTSDFGEDFKSSIEGKTISFTVTGEYALGNERKQIGKVKFTNFTISDDMVTRPTAEEYATATIAANLIGLTKLDNVYAIAKDGNVVTVNTQSDGLGDSYKVYNIFNVVSTIPESTVACNVKGLFNVRDGQQYIMPVLATDFDVVEKQNAQLPTVSPAGGASEGAALAVPGGQKVAIIPASGFKTYYSVNGGDEQEITTQKAEVTLENDAYITVRATRPYYNEQSATYYYKIDQSLTAYTITKPGVGYYKYDVNNPGTAMKDELVTLTITPNEHWNIDAVKATYNTTEVIMCEAIGDNKYTFTMPAANVAISVDHHKDPTYKITYLKGDVTGVTGDDITESQQYEGTTLTLKECTWKAAGYSFVGWKAFYVTPNAQDETKKDTTIIPINDNKITVPPYEVKIQAQWDEVAWHKDGTWELVTKTDELKAGDYVIFTDTLATADSRTAGTSTVNTANKNLKTTTNISINGNKLTRTNNDGSMVFQVETGNVEGTFAFYADGVGYLNANGTGDNNYMITTESKASENASWEVKSIYAPTGGATVQAKSDNRNLMQLNNTVFAAYGSKQKGLAIYKFYPKAWQVTFDDNVEDEEITVPEMQRADPTTNKVTISTMVPERTGYEFSKWNSAQGGTGLTSADPGQEIELSKNTTLYAQWNIKQYNVAVAEVENVTINAKPYGEADITEGTNADVNFKKSVVLTYSELNEDYVFKSWKVTKADEPSVEVPISVGSSTTFEVPAYAVTVSAVIESKATTQLTVTYHANGGKNKTAGDPEEVSEQVNWNTTIKFAEHPCPFEKNLCTFVGWNTKADGSGTTYKTQVTVKTDIDLYAMWEASAVEYVLDAKETTKVKVKDGVAPKDATAAYTTDYSTLGQLTDGKYGTLTLTGFAGKVITGVKMEMKTNKSGGAGTIVVKVGETEICSTSYSESFGGYTQSYIVADLKNFIPTIVNENEDITIKTVSSDNSLYINGYTIEYEDAEATVIRDNLTIGQYTTYCEPYAVVAGSYSGATFWNIADKTYMSDGVRLASITIEQHLGDLEAGVPYIMLPEDAQLTGVKYGEAIANPVEEGNNGLYGTFVDYAFDENEAEARDAQQLYVISNGLLYLCGYDCGVYAHRAYIKSNMINYVAPSGAPRRYIGNPNGTPTNLNGLNGNVKAQKALIDGHIYIIRDNKMYNAQGLFVK